MATSRITFPVQRITGAARAGGLVVYARLIHTRGLTHGALDLDTNKVLSLEPERFALDAEGVATMDLVRNSDMPEGWAYEISVRGAAGGQSMVWYPVYIPDADRSIDQVFGQLSPGVLPRYALITNDQLDALIRNHGVGVLTGGAVEGTGRTGDVIDVRDGGIDKVRLDPALATDLGGSVKASTVTVESDQLQAEDNEGNPINLELGTSPVTIARRVNALPESEAIDYERLKNRPTIPTNTADADELAREKANIDHLQEFEQGFLHFTSGFAAAGWTQAIGNAASQLAGNPAIPAGLADARLEATIGGEGSGSHVFRRADLLALPAVGRSTPLTGSNAISWAHDGNTYYVANAGGNHMWVASDTAGAFTLAMRVGVVRVDGPDLNLNQRLPAPAGDKFLAWNTAGTEVENRDEPAGTDESEVNRLIGAKLEPYAEKGKTDRIGEGRLPQDLDDLLDAVDDAGWSDPGDDAASNAFVKTSADSAARTLAQAAAATYGAEYRQSPRLTNSYVTIRRPNDLALAQLRLVVGLDTYLGKDWAVIGTQGSYTYYSVLARDFPAGDPVRVQEYHRFQLDRARIYVEDGRVPPITNADTTKWLRVKADATGFEFVDSPAGAKGDPGPPGPAADVTQEAVYGQSKNIIRAGRSITIQTDDTTDRITINAGPTARGTTFPDTPAQGDVFELLAQQTLAVGAVLTVGEGSNEIGWDGQTSPGIGSIDREPEGGLDAIAWAKASNLTALRGRYYVDRDPTQSSKVPKTLTIAGTDYALTVSGASTPTWFVSPASANTLVAGATPEVQLVYTDGSKAWPDITYQPGIYVRDGIYWRKTTTLSGSDIRDLIQSLTGNDRLSALYLKDLPAQTHVEVLMDATAPGVHISNTGQNRASQLAAFPNSLDLDDVENGEIAAEVTYGFSNDTGFGSAKGFTTAGEPTHRETDILFASELRALSNFDTSDATTWIAIGNAVRVYNGSVHVGTAQLVFGHDGNNVLGYSLRYTGVAQTNTFSLSARLSVVWSPTDAPDQSGRISDDRLPAEVEEFHDAITGRTWVNEGSDPSVNDFVNVTRYGGLITAEQARGLTYHPYAAATGTSTSQRYMHVRRIRFTRIENLRFVLFQGSTNTPRHVVPSSSWNLRGSQGDFDFYAVPLPNVTNGDVARVQRESKFHFDEDVVDVEAQPTLIGTWSGGVSQDAWTPTTLRALSLAGFQEIGVTLVTNNSLVISGSTTQYHVKNPIQWVSRSAIGRSPSVNVGRFPMYIYRHVTPATAGMRQVEFLSARVSSNGLLEFALSGLSLEVGPITFYVYGK